MFRGSQSSEVCDSTKQEELSLLQYIKKGLNNELQGINEQDLMKLIKVHK
jgi:hypothetical protein